MVKRIFGGVGMLVLLALAVMVISVLILVDAAGIPRKPQPGEKIPLGFRLARMPVLNKLMLFVSPRSMFAEGLHKVFVDQSKVTEAMITRYYDLNLYDGNRRATGIRFRLPNNDEAVAEKPGAIKAPTLILWGDKAPLIRCRDVRAYGEMLARSARKLFSVAAAICGRQSMVHQIGGSSCNQKRDYMRWTAYGAPALSV